VGIFVLEGGLMANSDIQGKLTPTKSALGCLGLGVFATGGCLMWTIILIPLAVPMALLGLLMAVGSLFIKTEPLECPACQQSSKVENAVQVVVCPHCEIAIRRGETGWIRV
jgi:hypothetical protein